MAGERYARLRGATYDPLNPAHGGYQHITPEEWATFERAMAAWQLRYRYRIER